MQLSELIAEIKDIENFCKTHNVDTALVDVNVRDCKGERHLADSLYSLIGTRREIVINCVD